MHVWRHRGTGTRQSFGGENAHDMMIRTTVNMGKWNKKPVIMEVIKKNRYEITQWFNTGVPMQVRPGHGVKV